MSMETGHQNSTFDLEHYTNFLLQIQILHFQFYAWGVVGNIISGLGIVGNLLSIVVLMNKSMRSSTSIYLIAQSIFDIIVLISLTLFMALPTIHYTTGLLESYAKFYPYLHPYAYPLALTAQTCSIYTTVSFTGERYIAVCHPLKAARWCTVKRSKLVIIFIIFFSVIYNIPRLLEYETIVSVDRYNESKLTYGFTKLGSNPVYRHIYFIYMNITVMLLVPFSILAVMNTCLIRAVRRSQQTGGKFCQKQSRENNLTIMLISVVVVFLLLQVPSIVDNILMATLQQDQLSTPPFVKLTCISSLMVISNSTANFYLYCVFGQKFRQIFNSIFCRWHCLTKVFMSQRSTSTRSGYKSKKYYSETVDTNAEKYSSSQESNSILFRNDFAANCSKNYSTGEFQRVPLYLMLSSSDDGKSAVVANVAAVDIEAKIGEDV